MSLYLIAKSPVDLDSADRIKTLLDIIEPTSIALDETEAMFRIGMILSRRLLSSPEELSKVVELLWRKNHEQKKGTTAQWLKSGCLQTQVIVEYVKSHPHAELYFCELAVDSLAPIARAVDMVFVRGKIDVMLQLTIHEARAYAPLDYSSQQVHTKESAVFVQLFNAQDQFTLDQLQDYQQSNPKASCVYVGSLERIFGNHNNLYEQALARNLDVKRFKLSTVANPREFLETVGVQLS